jgi:hypothetical protein
MYEVMNLNAVWKFLKTCNMCFSVILYTCSDIVMNVFVSCRLHFVHWQKREWQWSRWNTDILCKCYTTCVQLWLNIRLIGIAVTRNVINKGHWYPHRHARHDCCNVVFACQLPWSAQPSNPMRCMYVIVIRRHPHNIYMFSCFLFFFLFF